MLKSGIAKVFWSLAAVAFSLAFLVGVWALGSSGYMFRVLDYDYNPAEGTVTMTRQVLVSGDVIVRSYITVVGADGRECSARDEKPFEPFTPDGKSKTTETFLVPADLKPCLDQTPYTIVGRFQVKLLNFIPLKPTYYFEPPRGDRR